MTTAATTTTRPFRFFDAHVVRTRRLSPSLARITFGGEQLREFASGGRDQSFSLFLPHPGQEAPVVGGDYNDGWFLRFRGLSPSIRAVMRSYSVRDQRCAQDEVDVDFVLHGAGPRPDGGSSKAHIHSGSEAAGPASRWAAGAQPGNRVILLGPTIKENKSVSFRPPPETDWVLIAADETGLPAAAGILDWLPAGTRAKVWIEIPHPQDIQDLGGVADAEITWLVREDAAAGHSRRGLLVKAIQAAALPEGTPYAWIAGESGAVKALRRHLVDDRGFDRKAVNFSGYWRRGTSEEDLRAKALSGSTPTDGD